MLTQKRLRELLDYDPLTGVFTRKVSRPGPRGHVGAVAGCDNGQGYIRIYVDGVPYKAHRLAWFYTYGDWPAEIDHINGNRSDNSISNLRNVTRRENKMNAAVYRNNTSGLAGVSYNQRRKKWVAQIQVDGRKMFLGAFENPNDASARYKEASGAYFGEYARAS